MSTSGRKRSLPAEVLQAKQKHARTSQSCGPCRARVSRCDKQRPCSSCILANTQSQCYPDAAAYRPPPSYLVSRALSRRGPQTHRILGAPMGRRGSSGQQLYEGPTAVLMTLAPLQDKSPEVPPVEISPERIRKPYRPDKDLDVVSKLPSRDVCERIVDYYFEHCTWIYKYFDRRAFTERLSRWRTDEETDSLTLAGVAIICAIVVHCLPPHHELACTLKVFPDYKPLPPGASAKDIQSAREMAHADSTVNRASVIGAQFYNVCELALEREKEGRKVHVWTMDFLEVVLGKCHYLGLSRVDTEELWALRGELVSMATALGLHRYPGKNVPHPVAERHRWIWGNIIFLERWQALMHGRPLSILPEHFDVALPSSEPIPLPTQTSHVLDAQFSVDLSGNTSVAPSSNEPGQSLMPSLSRRGRTESMPNIAQLGLEKAENLMSPLAPEAGSSTSGPALEGWAPVVEKSHSSSVPTTMDHIDNPFALSLDPDSLLLDPAKEAQMFGTLPPLSGISEDISDAGGKPTWDMGGNDFSTWNAMMTQSPVASGAGQGRDLGNILRALPGPEESGTRTYEAHVAHFHLAHILGRITEALLSLRPVAYARIQSCDDELQGFMDTLAPSLKLSAEDIAERLISQSTGLRRQGVQALVVGMAALHIRFMLHRPYASGEVTDWPLPPSQDLSSAASSQAKGDAYLEAQKEREYRREVRLRADEHATSLAKAIEAAQELIELAVITVPKMTHANACAEHAHLNWAPVQVTGAALFLIYVVVTSPTPSSKDECIVEPTIPQPISASSSASSNSNLSYPSLNAFILLPIIRRALRFLQEIAYMSTAHNSASLLQHLEPLFSESFVLASKEERLKVQRETLMNVERLNMPYRDGGTVGIVGGVSPPAPPQPVGLGKRLPNPSILQDIRRSSDTGISRAQPLQDGVRPSQPTRSASLKEPPRITAANATRAHVHFAPDPPRTTYAPAPPPTTSQSRTPRQKDQTNNTLSTTQTTCTSTPALSTHATPEYFATSSTYDSSQRTSPSTAQAPQDRAHDPPRVQIPTHTSTQVPPPPTLAHTMFTKSFSPDIVPYPTLNMPPSGSAPPPPPSARPPPALSASSSVPSSQPPLVHMQTAAAPTYQPQRPQQYHMQPPPQLPPHVAPFAPSLPLHPPPGLPPTSSAFSNLSQRTIRPPSVHPPTDYAANTGGPPSAGSYLQTPPAPLSGYAIFSGYPNAQSSSQYTQAPVTPSAVVYTQGGRLGYPPGFDVNSIYGASTDSNTPPNAAPLPSESVPIPPTQTMPPPPSVLQGVTNAQAHTSGMWHSQQPPAPHMLSNSATPFPASGDPSFWTNMAGQQVGPYGQSGLQNAQYGHGPQSFVHAQSGATQGPWQPAPPYPQQGMNYQTGYGPQGIPPGQPMYRHPGLQMHGQQASPYGGPPQGPPIMQPAPQYGHSAVYGQSGAYGQQQGGYGQPGIPRQQQQYHEGTVYLGGPPGQNVVSDGQSSAFRRSAQTFSGSPSPPSQQQAQYYGPSGQH